MKRVLKFINSLFAKKKFSDLKSNKTYDGMIDSILIAECCRKRLL